MNAISIVSPESAPRRSDDWRAIMKNAVRDPHELRQQLDLPEHWTRRILSKCEFPVFAPQPFVSRIERGNPHDPLLRQIMPFVEEQDDVDGFSTDPVEDLEHRTAPGVIRKYRGRALLVATGVCAVHCRYCFRRHYPYSEAPVSREQWQATLDQLSTDATLEEVILSGGDPLTLVDQRFEMLAEQVATLPNLRRLRIHTRLPIVIPQRVTHRLLNCLSGLGVTVVVVVHVNHPREVDRDVADALTSMVDHGLTVLNQSVLLRGVNDSAETLATLCRNLVDLRVLPYYLHQLDRVAGAAHFEVPVEKGQQLVDQLLAELPGYAVPRYVRDVPGSDWKQTL